MKATYWSVMLPLIRPVLVKVAGFFALLVLGLCAVWGLEQWQAPTWKTAQQRMQSAQSVLTQANTDLADIERLRGEFNRHSQSGLVGGAPRAGWIEDLQRLAGRLGLEAVLTYTLASPVNVNVGGASAGKVTRHELNVSVASVHELEALSLVQQFVDLYPDTAQLTACEFSSPSETGLVLACKVNLLHIDAGPTSPAGVKP